MSIHDPFIVNLADLKRALKAVLPGAGRLTFTERKKFPILTCFHFTPSAGGITISTADMTHEASTEIAVEGRCPWAESVSVDRKQLMNFVTFAWGEKAVISLSQTDMFCIVAGGLRVALRGHVGDAFRIQMEEKPPVTISIAGADLHRAFAAALPDVSTEETRYYLNGICMHATKGGIFAVATDGHRLTRARICGRNRLPEFSAIVPTLTCKLVVAHLARMKAPENFVQVELQGTWEKRNYSQSGQQLKRPRKYISFGRIRFTFDDITVTAKLVDGTYPDYTRVIPKNAAIEATMAKQDIVRPLKVIAACGTKASSQSARLNVQPTAALLTAERDEGLFHSPVAARSNGSIEIGFNANYLFELARRIDAEDIAFHLADPQAPAIVGPARKLKPNDPLHVLMPMRV